MKKYHAKAAHVTMYYDEEPKELEITTTATGTLEELIADAKRICETKQRFDDYFRTMTMDAEPFNVMTDIESGEGYIDITYHFTEGDYTTEMNVSYVVEEEK